MKEQKNKVANWFKAHKEEIILFGTGIAVTVSIFIGMSCDKQTEYDVTDEKTCPGKLKALRDESFCDVKLMDSSDFAEKNDSTSEQSKVIYVSPHIRNLSEGKHPSVEKLNSATENGFDLQSNQTWVGSYVKGREVA